MFFVVLFLIQELFVPFLALWYFVSVDREAIHPPPLPSALPVWYTFIQYLIVTVLFCFLYLCTYTVPMLSSIMFFVVLFLIQLGLQLAYFKVRSVAVNNFKILSFHLFFESRCTVYSHVHH